MTQIYKWKCTLVSTSPLRIGDDEDSIVLDQFGRPFIPGTSFAGACRAFLQTICSEKDINTLFGSENSHARDAILIFSDGKSDQKYASEVRTRIRMEGATKTTKTGGLFQQHMLAPGATFYITITLKTKEEHEHYAKMIEKMLQAIHSGVIRFGAHKSIGNGRLSIQSCEYVHYNCTKEADLYAYIDDSKQYEKISFEESYVNEGVVQFTIKGKTDSPLLIGGQYPNESSKPDETYMTTADGKPMIPGSSLKGVLRHRVNRIANVLELPKKEKYIALLFGADSDGNDEWKDEGTGSLQLEDIILTEEKTKVYYRNSINPFTGGTRDGALLNEETVYGSFETTLQVQLKEKESEDVNISLALLLFALRDLAVQKATIGSGASIGRGFLAIEKITMKEGEKEVVFHVKAKETTGDKQWLKQLQGSLEKVQALEV